MIDASVMFNLLELLHVAALLPSLFAMILLLSVNRNVHEVTVPLLFFASLSASFVLGILNPPTSDPSVDLVGLLWLESLQPAFCFLLIVQLWQNRLPPAVYWSILAVPLLGGGMLVYASLQLEQACMAKDLCVPTTALRMLYHVFATGLMFLFLIVHLFAHDKSRKKNERQQKHRYWLMISLIVLFMVLLALDLTTIMHWTSDYQRNLVHVMVRIAFIYLAISSIFRIFDQKLSMDHGKAPADSKPVDPEILAMITEAMEEDKLYREMGFNRERCATQLGIAEHVLSRAINQAFGRNFNEFINSYRVEEAKTRLKEETTSITAIAFEVGFSSIASFNRVFKSMVGRSPTEFRASAQEKYSR